MKTWIFVGLVCCGVVGCGENKAELANSSCNSPSRHPAIKDDQGCDACCKSVASQSFAGTMKAGKCACAAK